MSPYNCPTKQRLSVSTSYKLIERRAGWRCSCEFTFSDDVGVILLWLSLFGFVIQRQTGWWGWKLRFCVEAQVLVRFLFYSDKAVYNLRGMQLLSKIRPNPLPIILLVALNFSHHDAKYHKLSRWMWRASAHSTLSVLSRFACAYCGTILVKTQHFLRQLNAELKRVEKTSTS